MNQEQFLKLFVTQLQNQDPMNPQEATEMSSQLAQYSQLEQLTNLNKGMKELIQSNLDSDKLTSLSTIGRNVTYKSSKIHLTDKPVEIGYQLDAAATDVTVTIKKKNAVIATLKGEELSAGNHYLTWNGKNSNEIAAAPGEYTFSIQATGKDGKTKDIPTLIREEVTGIDLAGAKGGTLMTNNGGVGFKDILGVFDKQGTTTPAAS